MVLQIGSSPSVDSMASFQDNKNTTLILDPTDSSQIAVPQQNVLTLKELIEKGWSTQRFPAALGDSGKDKLSFRSSEQTPLRVGRHRNIQLHWNFDGGTYEA